METEQEDNVIPYIKVYKYATKLDIFMVFMGVICSIGVGVCLPVYLYVFGDLTDKIIKYEGVRKTPNITDNAKKKAQDEFMDDVAQFALYESIVGVAMLIFCYASTTFFNYSSIRQIYKIRAMFFQSALNQDIAWYDVNRSGDFASRVSEDMTKIQNGIGEKIAFILQGFMIFVSCNVFAVVMGWKLTLVCFSPWPVLVVFGWIVGMCISKVSKREVDALASVNAVALEVLSSIKTVVAFGGEQKELDRFSSKLKVAKDSIIRRSLLFAMMIGFIYFVTYGCCHALSFWYGIRLVLNDKDLPESEKQYKPGNMIMVVFGIMVGSVHLGTAFIFYDCIGIARAAASKIFAIIDSVPTINLSKDNGLILDRVMGNIIFKNVYFNYPSRPDIMVLQGLSLEIFPGQTIAFVGMSGCGKSTAIQLIQRFYDPLVGYITVDGIPMTSLDLAWYRSQIGMVGQEPILFETTIYENIRFGYMEATTRDIHRAAKKANAHKFIVSLPRGYNTMVGQRGTQLSGGQKQRIAIARALVREPSILILDEATSALDTHSEAKVQAAIDNVRKECTTIIVAHRLSTIRNADRIVVFEEGKVVEDGDHNELMELQRAYYTLVSGEISHDTDQEEPDIDEDDFFLRGLTPEGSRASLLQVAGSRPVSRTSSLAPRGSLVPRGSIGQSYANVGASRGSIVTRPISEASVAADRAKSHTLWTIMKANRPELCHIITGCLMALIMGVATPTVGVVFGDVIRIMSETDADVIRGDANRVAIIFIVVGVVTGIASFVENFMFGYAGGQLTVRLRRMMFDAILQQEIGWFDREENSVGSLCSQLSSEAGDVQGATGQRISTTLESISTITLACGLSLYYDWSLGLVAISFVPPIFLSIYFHGRITFKENQKELTSIERSNKLAVEAVSNIRTVAALGCEDIFYAEYIAELLPHSKVMLRNTHIRGIVYGLSKSLMCFAYAGCFYYGAVLARDKGMLFENVMKVAYAVLTGAMTVASAMAFTPDLEKGVMAAHKIYKLMHRQPVVRDSPFAQTKTFRKGTIEYNKVFFSYPTRKDMKVLRGFDLVIKHGQNVALVGPSGCGKSTVIQLLLRYYDPTSGRVNLEGDDLRTYSMACLRGQMSIVSQEPVLFDRTIADNIAYGDNRRTVDMMEIIDAAKNANIHNFIASLPQGYQTSLGERGTHLSGGQKQRIAIARAMIRNPKILILDEATSALDTESEKIVQKALVKAQKGRTCVTIAHRLTTIQNSDVICVLNNGKMAEMGTHAELLTKKGIYYTLCRLQEGRRY